MAIVKSSGPRGGSEEEFYRLVVPVHLESPSQPQLEDFKEPQTLDVVRVVSPDGNTRWAQLV